MSRPQTKIKMEDDHKRKMEGNFFSSMEDNLKNNKNAGRPKRKMEDNLKKIKS
jgi:hypothetical protein